MLHQITFVAEGVALGPNALPVKYLTQNQLFDGFVFTFGFDDDPRFVTVNCLKGKATVMTQLIPLTFVVSLTALPDEKVKEIKSKKA